MDWPFALAVKMIEIPANPISCMALKLCLAIMVLSLREVCAAIAVGLCNPATNKDSVESIARTTQSRAESSEVPNFQREPIRNAEEQGSLWADQSKSTLTPRMTDSNYH